MSVKGTNNALINDVCADCKHIIYGVKGTNNALIRVGDACKSEYNAIQIV